jgi:acyl-coenzyme A thioesterase PaaI-like protein
MEHTINVDVSVYSQEHGTKEHITGNGARTMIIDNVLHETIDEITPSPSIGPDPPLHRRCFACGQDNDRGLGLTFSPIKNDSIEGYFLCDDSFQGYKDTLHGGIIATILDSAMVNYLFSLGITARTGRLNIRYYLPVKTNCAARVNAWLFRSRAGLFVMKGNLSQHGKVCAEAKATFIRTADTLEL